MTKFKRIATAVIAISALATSMTTSVAASTSKPYGDYDVTISDGFLGGKDTATAYITKCDCSPVNNFLAACIQIQYESGNNYHWTPSSSSFYYDRGYNINEARKSISEYNIRYAKGYFEATCGSSAMFTVDKTETS